MPANENSPPARWLAIDFGLRRIGLAMSDPNSRLALPLETLQRRDDRSAVRSIDRLIAIHKIDRLLLGEPRHLDGTRSEFGDRIDRFAERLHAKTGLPVTRVDEALTSHEAKRRLRDAGVDVRRHPERIDAVAAQILLEEHLLVEHPLEERPAAKPPDDLSSDVEVSR